MIALLLLLQSVPSHVARDTATYATPALREVVAAASALNQRVPPGLGRYTASVESEVSLGLRDGTADREVTTSIEQVASDVAWKRTGAFEQHITGYRSQSLGPQFSTLGFFRNAWVVPSLYGNRLALLFGRDSSYGRRGGRSTNRATTWAIHPLAEDRERVYRYAGGDTIEALRVGSRTIRIIRLDVMPREDLAAGSVVFTGELDLDADRMHVVRMRGSFAQVERAASPGVVSMLRATTRLEAITFVELVNREIDEEFWLPQYQRFEGQVVAPVLGRGKAILRIVSTFGPYVITPPSTVDAIASDSVRSSRSPEERRRGIVMPRAAPFGGDVAATDTLETCTHFLTLASRDSMSAFRAWRSQLGVESSSVRSEDFADVSPMRWRRTGPPLVELETEAPTDLMRIDRVEGVFTGMGVGVRFRDAMPGLTAHVIGGYAWSERTARGRLTAELARDAWRYAVRAGRSLDPTNDFTTALDSVSALGALFGQDDYDYVDRRSAGLLATRRIGGDDALVRVEAGWAQDRGAATHLAHGLIGHEAFLPNRGVDAGDYLRTALAFEWHPDVDARFLQTGTGASLHYLRGDGQLRFERIEGRVTTRHNVESWTFALRADAGVVLGDAPPQQLFEVGRELNLPGYDYKAFAGDQAVVVRGLVMYGLPWLRAPLQFFRQYWLPAPAPALTASLQSGWTGVSSTTAAAAMQRLVTGARATGSARASIAAGIRFFGGAVGLDLARPIDHAEAWTLRFTFGPSF
ncbi:MAG: hypothetical protein HYR75_00480 [Gemmatimonadetes bacterium]|nr:hypothetical protein [Gemmatimonadota bacterium]MBI3504590.1 hypothetical protein [Pseudomonadota bacterium]